MKVVMLNAFIAFNLMLLREGTTDYQNNGLYHRTQKLVSRRSTNQLLNLLVDAEKKTHCHVYSCSVFEGCGNPNMNVDSTNHPCSCDSVCWVYGDCCFDYYGTCLGVYILASTQQLLSATLANLATLDDVYRFREKWRLARIAKCLKVHFSDNVIYDVQIINGCSPHSKEIFRQLLNSLIGKKVYQSQEQEDEGIGFLSEMSEEEIVIECGRKHSGILEKSKCTSSKVSSCIFVDLSDKESDIPLLNQLPVMHVFLPGINFRNVFCGVCNGVHPSLLIKWTVNQKCLSNRSLNVTLLSRATNLENTDCEFSLEQPKKEKLRFCIESPESENEKHLNSNIVKSLDMAVKSSTDLTSEVLETIETCASSALPFPGKILCSRYRFPFKCSGMLDYSKNPHCMDKCLGLNNSESIDKFEIFATTFLYCKGKINCAFNKMNPQSMFSKSFHEKAPDFRTLLNFRKGYVDTHKVSGDTAMPLQCPNGQTYVHFYDRCQPVVCASGLRVEGRRCVQRSDAVILHNKTNISIPSTDARLPFYSGSCNIKIILTVKHALSSNKEGPGKDIKSPKSDASEKNGSSPCNANIAPTKTKKNLEQALSQNQKERLGNFSTEEGSYDACLESDNMKSFLVGSPDSLQQLNDLWINLHKEPQPISHKIVEDNLVRLLHDAHADLYSRESVSSLDSSTSVSSSLCTYTNSVNCYSLFQMENGSLQTIHSRKVDMTNLAGDQLNEQKTDLNIDGTYKSHGLKEKMSKNEENNLISLCFPGPTSNPHAGQACFIFTMYLNDPLFFDNAMETLHENLAKFLNLARRHNVLIDSTKLTNMANPYNKTGLSYEAYKSLKRKGLAASAGPPVNVSPVCEDKENTITRSAQIKMNSSGSYEAVLDGYSFPLSQLAFSSELSISDATLNGEFTNVSVSWCTEKSSALNCSSSAFVQFSGREFVLYKDFLILSDDDGNLTSYLNSLLNTTEALTASGIEKVIFTYKQDQGKRKNGQSDSEVAPLRVFDKTQYELSQDGALVCFDTTQNHPKHRPSWLEFNYKPASITEQIVSVVSNCISIVSLALVLFVYTSLSELRNVPGLVVMSLSVTWLLAQVHFLLCLYPAKISSLFCQVYAAVHHATWLSAFFWLGCMAINLVRLLHFGVRSAPGKSCSRGYITMATVCWGVPVCVSTLCFFLDHYKVVDIGYGRASVCWIGNPISLLYIFVAPLFVIVFISIVCCVLVVRTVSKSAAFRHANARTKYSTDRSTEVSTVNSEETAQASAHERGNRSDSNVGVELKTEARQSGRRNQALMCVYLSLLMGGNWIFYLAAAAMKDQEVLWILTAIFSGCQGFFVFLCFVAKRSLIIKVFNRWKCKQRS